MSDNFLKRPNSCSDLRSWLEYIEKIHTTTIELGLNRVSSVATKLSLLKPAPYVITVAGTNGKGTTCRALEMILLEAGYKVGVYSSPHLINYTERVRINNAELAESKHAQSFDKIENARGNISLTYFEYATLSALMLFKEANLDVVILEVGLGGRLDATNIVDADLAVITSIAIDHTDYLGFDRESIGREKAGIIKSNSIVIIGEPNMPNSIFEIASKMQAKLYRCESSKNLNEEDWTYQINHDQTWNITANGKTINHIKKVNIPTVNAATAIASLAYSKLNVNETFIKEGLKKTSLIGRTQIINQSPLVMVDVAHNPHAASYLNQYIKTLKETRKNINQIRLVVGMLRDKDIKNTLKILSADHWYLASLHGERGALYRELLTYLNENQKKHTQTFDLVKIAYKKALSDANQDDLIVVCGSFHTVSQVLGDI